MRVDIYYTEDKLQILEADDELPHGVTAIGYSLREKGTGKHFIIGMGNFLRIVEHCQVETVP